MSRVLLFSRLWVWGSIVIDQAIAIWLISISQSSYPLHISPTIVLVFKQEKKMKQEVDKKKKKKKALKIKQCILFI